jgi:predicted negative regulator of RcsB-dependent stress response
MSYDLEEQEQLAQIKHFWAQYGNLITWALIAVLGAFAAYNGWNWYRADRSSKAAAVFDELERAVQAKDAAKVEQVFGDLRERFGGTAFAQMGALAAAKGLADNGKLEQAEAALRWAADKSVDPEYRALARLRLAGLLLQRKQYDEALKLVETAPVASMAPLYADRRGDILWAQGKNKEAAAEFKKALDGFDKTIMYRDFVELKLNAAGGAAS